MSVDDGAHQCQAQTAACAITRVAAPSQLVEDRITQDRPEFVVALSGADLGKLHRLYELGEVLSREDDAEGVTHAVLRVPDKHEHAFHAEFPQARPMR